MLRSIVRLDTNIANQICEQATDERVVTQRLKHLVRHHLRTQGILKQDWYEHLYATYHALHTQSPSSLHPDTAHTSTYSAGTGAASGNPASGLDDEGMNVKVLKRFLHTLQVYLTDDSIHHLFQILDSDHDGIITWEQLATKLLPEVYKKQISLQKRKLSQQPDGGNHVAFEYQLTQQAASNKRPSLVSDVIRRSSEGLRQSILFMQRRRSSAKGQQEVVASKGEDSQTNLAPSSSHVSVSLAHKLFEIEKEGEDLIASVSTRAPSQTHHHSTRSQMQEEEDVNTNSSDGMRSSDSEDSDAESPLSMKSNARPLSSEERRYQEHQLSREDQDHSHGDPITTMTNLRAISDLSSIQLMTAEEERREGVVVYDANVNGQGVSFDV
jgi:hypothetical protein